MSTENPVFRLLTTSGNASLLAAGNKADALAVGQLGLFNFHTGLSVDGTSLADARDVYLALGVGTGGVLSDIKKSSGQMIQVRNAKALTVKGYVSSLPKIVEVSGFTAKCETDYALKIEFRNQQAYGVFGYNSLAKTFDYHSDPCLDCDTCQNASSSIVDLALSLANSINADEDALATATLFAYKILATITAGATADGILAVTVGAEVFNVAVVNADTATVVAGKIVAAINASATSNFIASNIAGAITIYAKVVNSGSTDTFALTSAGGTGVTAGSISGAKVDVTIANTPAFKAANVNAGLAIRITGFNGVNTSFNGHIPIKYYNAKETDLIVSIKDGFWNNGTITTIQNLQYEDGNGINLEYDEYLQGGFDGNPGPYRVSSITGLEKGTFDSSINPASNYNTVVLEYDIESVGGWDEYKNNNRTIIAIPCADSTTLTSLFTVFDLIFTQFQAKSNDVAAMDCTNVSVNAINDVTKDGISILSF